MKFLYFRRDTVIREECRRLQALEERYLSFEQNVGRQLIDFSESFKFEKLARKVKCMTSNLIWAHEKRNELIASATKIDQKTIQYIVYGDGDESSKRKVIDRAKGILSIVGANKRLRERKAVNILFLIEGDEPVVWTPCSTPEERVLHASWARLPYPTDIVLYEETRANPSNLYSALTTFAVMPMRPIKEQRFAGIDLGEDREIIEIQTAVNNRDIKLEHPEHFNPFKEWFDSEWKKISELK